MKVKEANLISFKVIFDAKGKLLTETSSLPLTDASKLFKGYDLRIVETILRETKTKVLNIHNELEAELNALNHKF
jgi:hypothetical protein|tara:strand:- start:1144 stop:1368 length:225 start_codon:yes stop_codon:yes gene_type:complete